MSSYWNDEHLAVVEDLAKLDPRNPGDVEDVYDYVRSLKRELRKAVQEIRTLRLADGSSDSDVQSLARTIKRWADRHELDDQFRLGVIWHTATVALHVYGEDRGCSTGRADKSEIWESCIPAFPRQPGLARERPDPPDAPDPD